MFPGSRESTQGRRWWGVNRRRCGHWKWRLEERLGKRRVESGKDGNTAEMDYYF